MRRVGYWRSEADESLPNPADYIDWEWDEDERGRVAWYFSHGTLLRAYMGLSPCRICGVPNGSLELTDGDLVWPEGLAHYIEEHAVRLPAEVVDHATSRLDQLEGEDVDEDWWRSSR